MALTLIAEDRAVFFQRQFDIVDLIAAMNGGRDVFAPAFDPFHRPSGFLREIAGQSVFGVEIDLGSKPAANFGRNDP